MEKEKDKGKDKDKDGARFDCTPTELVRFTEPNGAAKCRTAKKEAACRTDPNSGACAILHVDAAAQRVYEYAFDEGEGAALDAGDDGSALDGPGEADAEGYAEGGAGPFGGAAAALLFLHDAPAGLEQLL
eukprot:tig00000204_g17705.t1